MWEQNKTVLFTFTTEQKIRMKDRIKEMNTKMRAMKCVVWGITLAAGALFAEAPVHWRAIDSVTTTSSDTQLTVAGNVPNTEQFMDDLGEVELDPNGHFITVATGSAGVKVIYGANIGTPLRIVDSLQIGTAMVCIS